MGWTVAVSPASDITSSLDAQLCKQTVNDKAKAWRPWWGRSFQGKQWRGMFSSRLRFCEHFSVWCDGSLFWIAEFGFSCVAVFSEEVGPIDWHDVVLPRKVQSKSPEQGNQRVFLCQCYERVVCCGFECGHGDLIWLPWITPGKTRAAKLGWPCMFNQLSVSDTLLSCTARCVSDKRQYL